ncbi:Protein ALWAYS EARLY 3 [Camellia lanceoleosa]|uniref:Protein ALWAYS EARLY 3 n=1 Tax=Camellia lanceoleosa TaxID=1840588 RepID=A0ACC0G148_9ERIC|nr:Protein ALWAYS EARLY 3 [Camellia lanceoleosa]
MVTRSTYELMVTRSCFPFILMNLGSKEVDNRDFARERNFLTKTEVVGTAEARKGRNLHGKKLEVDNSGNHNLDDTKEACSGTEGQNISSVREKLEFEVTDGKVAWSSSQVSRKKSKKVLFRKRV